jgi:hypothetical protein
MLQQLLDVLEDMETDDQQDLLELFSELSVQDKTSNVKIIFHGNYFEVLTQRKKYYLPCVTKSKIQYIPWIH